MLLAGLHRTVSKEPSSFTWASRQSLPRRSAWPGSWAQTLLSI